MTQAVILHCRSSKSLCWTLYIYEAKIYDKCNDDIDNDDDDDFGEDDDMDGMWFCSGSSSSRPDLAALPSHEKLKMETNSSEDDDDEEEEEEDDEGEKEKEE